MQILQTLISVLLVHLSLVASSANQGSRNTQCGATFRSLSDFVVSEGDRDPHLPIISLSKILHDCSASLAFSPEILPLPHM
jgi:hypothetical protein